MLSINRNLALFLAIFLVCSSSLLAASELKYKVNKLPPGWNSKALSGHPDTYVEITGPKGEELILSSCDDQTAEIWQGYVKNKSCPGGPISAFGKKGVYLNMRGELRVVVQAQPGVWADCNLHKLNNVDTESMVRMFQQVTAQTSLL